MEFVRGLDPKEAMELGWRATYKSMNNCLLLTEKDLYQNIRNRYDNIRTIRLTNIRLLSRSVYDAYVIIIIFKEEFRIMKNRFEYLNYNYSLIYKIDELPKIIFELKKKYDNFIINGEIIYDTK